MIYIAYLRQSAQGCDYSIGCGLALWRRKAITRDEAIEELKRDIIGIWSEEEARYVDGYHGTSKLEKVILFEVSGEEEMPIDQWYSEAEDYTRQEKTRIEETRERAELERLRAKYG
jgi:hypothetical protein